MSLGLVSNMCRIMVVVPDCIAHHLLYRYKKDMGIRDIPQIVFVGKTTAHAKDVLELRAHGSSLALTTLKNRLDGFLHNSEHNLTSNATEYTS